MRFVLHDAPNFVFYFNFIYFGCTMDASSSWEVKGAFLIISLARACVCAAFRGTEFNGKSGASVKASTDPFFTITINASSATEERRERVISGSMGETLIWSCVCVCVCVLTSCPEACDPDVRPAHVGLFYAAQHPFFLF